MRSPPRARALEHCGVRLNLCVLRRRPERWLQKLRLTSNAPAFAGEHNWFSQTMLSFAPKYHGPEPPKNSASLRAKRGNPERQGRGRITLLTCKVGAQKAVTSQVKTRRKPSKFTLESRFCNSATTPRTPPQNSARRAPLTQKKFRAETQRCAEVKSQPPPPVRVIQNEKEPIAALPNEILHCKVGIRPNATFRVQRHPPDGRN